MAAALAGACVAFLAAGALASKWELGFGRSLPTVAAIDAAAAIAVGMAAGGLAPVAVAAVTFVAGSAVAAFVLLWRFYRDPDRDPPSRPDVVLSPADGEVVYVKRCIAGRIPVSEKLGRSYELAELRDTSLGSAETIVIGIAMSYLDVHVNRVPVAGTVAFRRRTPGRFASLKRPEALFENERLTTFIEGRSFDVAVVQIASRLVRRIVSYVDDGAWVQAGARMGAIRLGSQVDVVLPARPELAPAVTVGARVEAGTSVLAFGPASAGKPRPGAEPVLEATA